MAKWLEYEVDTGRILCLLTLADDGSGEEPRLQPGNALIAAPEDWDGDAEGWTVQDGELERTRMTPAERRELERQRRERAANAWKRVIQIKDELILALLEDDGERIAGLKAEYKRLKGLL